MTTNIKCCSARRENTSLSNSDMTKHKLEEWWWDETWTCQVTRWWNTRLRSGYEMKHKFEEQWLDKTHTWKVTTTWNTITRTSNKMKHKLREWWWDEMQSSEACSFSNLQQTLSERGDEKILWFLTNRWCGWLDCGFQERSTVLHVTSWHPERVYRVTIPPCHNQAFWPKALCHCVFSSKF